ncbi:3-hydroxyacyl-CoA dehydrogenase NAD-binding domain-containing protein [Rhodoplanes serenus]|uniref:3-hydroxyacyl-CoA dehydrogenase NAD-binding domain-containing protein n=2 Tax=Rhodoplanes serenus TaxID=200615 RepID=UPI0014790811
MTDLVRLERDGDVAVITIDNPPVNALKAEVRAGLLAAIAAVQDDSRIGAVVIRCAGRTFVAGADISELGKPAMQPYLPDVIEAIETCPKPVVAALHGTALGGGLEIALGCHYRVALAATRLGLPEIKLGLIPGAGGTQRLPRLVGPETAFAMVLSGEPIGAEEGQTRGLVDAIVPDLDAAAVAFAREAAARGQPPRTRDRSEAIAPYGADPAGLDALAAKHAGRPDGRAAPPAAVEALKAAVTLPFQEGIARERALFVALRDGPQSAAYRHLFAAERAAMRLDLPASVAARRIGRAAVIGAGTMGAGIAACFANAGLPVVMVDVSAESLARGRDTIEKTWAAAVQRGKLTAAEMERRRALLTTATELAAVAGAELVVEAAVEDMAVKRDVFAALDTIAPDAILATNTSYLDIDAIAAATRRPGRVLGLHFFSPATVMRLVEVVRAARTDPEVLATGVAVARTLGKVPVVVGVCHGFVGNRMLRVRTTETERLLLAGALPYEIDAALTEFGFPMGPCAVGDLAGLDIAWRMRKAQGARAEIADRLCEAGRFGQKTGRGYFRYEPGSRTPIRDPEVEALIVATSATLGITRRPFTADEIVERLLFPMVNEGARILAEGIARRAGDIDVIWVNGYGFPAYRGGPMHWADAIGLPRVRDRLTAIAAETGEASHAPAPLVLELAAAGRGFASVAS